MMQSYKSPVVPEPCVTSLFDGLWGGPGSPGKTGHWRDTQVFAVMTINNTYEHTSII